MRTVVYTGIAVAIFAIIPATAWLAWHYDEPSWLLLWVVPAIVILANGP